MMWTSDWDNNSREDRVEGEEHDREIRVMYMNVGRSADATHEFLERCVRGGIALAFVGECWVEKRSGTGTQSYPYYVWLGFVSGGGKVACHVRRDLVDYCVLAGCENRFICVEIGGVCIGGYIVSVGRRWMKCSTVWGGSRNWWEWSVAPDRRLECSPR